MTVSKRLRYEILRRDNHACRYCGATAPEVKLTVDHVTPTALGGTDDPANLVAACKDCNAGKSSSNPDQPLVEQVSDDAMRYAQAVIGAADLVRGERIQAADYANRIFEEWSGWEVPAARFGEPPTPMPIPYGWQEDVERFRLRGMPSDLLVECAAIALRARHVCNVDRWRYFMGCGWKRLTHIEEVAAATFQTEQ